MADRRVAIIGYGLAGRVFHGPLVAATPGLTVAAVVTTDAERRARATGAHPGAAMLDSPAALWERADELDAVVIATPNDSHAPLAMAAIDNGLAAVVDKPLALGSDQGRELIAHARAAGVLLTVFQNRRWDSDQLTLERLLADGALGTVLRHESRFERWRPESRPEVWREATAPEQGGGLLLDLGSHLVDQALHHFGPVVEVYAEIERRRGGAADDDVFLALTHRSGVISHLRASALTAAPGPRLRVLGSEAALVVRELDSQEERLRSGDRPDRVPDWGVEPAFAQPRLIAGERSVPLRAERGDWPQFYARFRDALAGDAPLPVDPQDAVAVLTVLEHARRSAADRAVVTIASVDD